MDQLFKKYYDILKNFGISDAHIMNMHKLWNESHRYYHNQEHLEEILNLIEKTSKGKEKELLVLIAFFHDVIYDPKSHTNEEDSAKLLKEYCKDITEEDWNIVNNAILDTKNHMKKPSNSISKKFLLFDLYGFRLGDLKRMLNDEKKISKEYEFVDKETYKKVRGKILQDFANEIKNKNSHLYSPTTRIDSYIDWFIKYK